MKSIEKVQNITSKGQITLPIEWRRHVAARQIILRSRGEKIEILPAKLPQKRTQPEKSLGKRTADITPRNQHEPADWGNHVGKEVW